MSNACSQDCITISPALNEIFNKHFSRTYMLTWVDGIIRRYRGKRESINAISLRYKTINAQNERLFNRQDNQVGLGGVKRFRVGIVKLLKDLEKCSHNDFNLICQMTPQEVFGTGMGNTTKIETINKKPFEVGV